MNATSPSTAFAADTVSDPGSSEAMDNEGGAPVAVPCPLAETERLHARAVARHAAAQAAAEAHSDEVRAAYEAIDWARQWRLPKSVEDEGWDYRWELEEASTAIWARAHMAHWVSQWARASVAKVRAVLGLPVDDVDLLDDDERDAYIAGLSDKERAELAWPCVLGPGVRCGRC